MSRSSQTQSTSKDVASIINQTIESLKTLVPYTDELVSDEIQDAVFAAIEAVDKDMRGLNLVIHGESPG
jgi:hypothetical protein